MKIGTLNLFLAILLFFTVCFFVFAWAHWDTEPAPQNKWLVRMKEVGIPTAYKEFGESVANVSPGSQHDAAHYFGSAMYQFKGIAGFADCGDAFSFGCAHAVAAEAILRDGTHAAEKLAEACTRVSYPAMCMHGIGHGFVHAYGYDDGAVRRAYSACARIMHDSTVAGCSGGATMEYNSETMKGENKKVRAYDEVLAYEPCASATIAAKSACYYWNVGWWYDALYSQYDLPALFKKMGELCSGIPDQEYLAECYGGEGQMAAAQGDYSTTSGEYCDFASSDSLARANCRGTAANFIAADPRHKDQSSLLCDALPKREAKICNYIRIRGVGIFDDGLPR